MRLLIAAVGRMKPGPEQQLYADYLKRLPWKVECKEFDVRLPEVKQRKSREAELLLDACAKYERLVALDEGGGQLSSREFTRSLGKWRQQGVGSCAFVIGGADGLDKRVLEKAHLTWSLGRVTWPHLLVRALLAEQLYRAHSILTNHPYHRD